LEEQQRLLAWLCVGITLHCPPPPTVAVLHSRTHFWIGLFSSRAHLLHCYRLLLWESKKGQLHQVNPETAATAFYFPVHTQTSSLPRQFNRQHSNCQKGHCCLPSASRCHEKQKNKNNCKRREREQ